MNEFPTLRVELDGVKYQVIHAFGMAMDELKDYAKSAIEASMNTLQQGSLERVIVECVESTMREAIHEGIKDSVKDAVDEYFSKGNGKEFIADAIVSCLKKR
jgi:hypothetical protein